MSRDPRKLHAYHIESESLGVDATAAHGKERRSRTRITARLLRALDREFERED